MPIIAPPRPPRELIPASNYVARCYKMIQMGTNKETMQDGSVKDLHKIRVGFELPGKLKIFNEAKGPQPLVIDKEYTLSMFKASNLRSDLKSWRGQDFTDAEADVFDVTTLVGVPCMLNIIHVTGKTGSVYEAIAGITPLPDGFTCPPQINPSQVLTFDTWDEELFNSLPDFLKDKIKTSPEYAFMKMPDAKSFLPPPPQSTGVFTPPDNSGLPF